MSATALRDHHAAEVDGRVPDGQQQRLPAQGSGYGEEAWPAGHLEKHKKACIREHVYGAGRHFFERGTIQPEFQWRTTRKGKARTQHQPTARRLATLRQHQRKRGRSKPQGTPRGKGDRNNRRTHARTSSEPRNRRRESPQKVGEKTCTVHMKAKRPKRQEKAGKERKRQEKTRKGTHCTPKAKRPKREALYKTVPQTAAPLARQQNRKVVQKAKK